MSEPTTVPHDQLRVIQDTLSQREKELAAAQRISEALSQRIKLQYLIEQALRTTLDVLDAENGSLLLADAETRQLVFYHSIGDKPVPHGTVIPSELPQHPFARRRGSDDGKPSRSSRLGLPRRERRLRGGVRGQQRHVRRAEP